MATYAFARSLLLREPVLPKLSLTVRETDVLHWIAEGKTDWEIAKILNVSEHLVDKMARQIRVKCGAVNRVQAVAFAIRVGIIR
jgi:LuxR family quorum sensing-dependent transcriptional regulator